MVGTYSPPHPTTWNNVPMFVVAAKKPRTSQLPVSCQRTGALEAGREHSQSNNPKLAHGIFQTTQHGAQYTDEGWLGSWLSLPGS